MKLNKLIAIATISLLSGGISMAQKALNLEDIVAGNIIQTKGIGSITVVAITSTALPYILYYLRFNYFLIIFISKFY